MVRWQDIATYASGGTLGLFLVLVGILNMSGMTYTIPEDQICTDCYDAIYVNSTIWEIKAEHAGDKDIVFAKRMRSRTRWVNLDKIDEFVDTSPKVPVEILVPTVKRYSTVKHSKYGYLRPIKDGDSLIARKNRNNPNGDWFVIHGLTGGQRVKWGMSLENWLMKDLAFDPVWEYGGSGTGNLMLHLKMNGDALDSSGRSNDGTVYGASIIPGRHGLTYDFDGTNDYINITKNDDFNLLMSKNYTFGVWFKTDDSDSVNQQIIGSYVSASGFRLRLDGLGKFELYLNTSGISSVEFRPYTTDVRDGLWHYGVMTINRPNSTAVNASVYMDGEYKASQVNVDAGWSDSNSTSSVVGVGSLSKGDSQFFNGSLDDLRFYDVELSPSEIRELYNETLRSHSVKMYGSPEEGVLASDSLVGHWKMNGDALDGSGSGNDGTVNGASIVPGRYGLAYQFDGVNDYITINSDNAYSSAFNETGLTFAVWVKRASNDSIHTVFSGDGANTQWVMRIKSTNVAELFYTSSGSNGVVEGTQTIYADGQWHHLVTTYNFSADEFSTYFDGELDNTVANSGDNFDSLRTYNRIGQRYSNLHQFDGGMDDLRIYNTTLSPSEIKRLYNETKTSPSLRIYGNPEEANPAKDNLVGHWKMNGNTLDSSGEENNGVLEGGSLTTGKFDLAYNFRGAVYGEYISTPYTDSDVNNLSKHSINSWLKFGDNIDDGGFSARTITGHTLDISLYYREAQNSIRCRMENTTTYRVADYVFDDETDHGWHMWTCTWDSTGDGYVRIYQDAIHVGTSTTPLFGVIYTDTNFSMGGDSIGRMFNGTVDEVRIYNTSLSASQIKQLYNETLTSPTLKIYGSPEVT